MRPTTNAVTDMSSAEQRVATANALLPVWLQDAYASFAQMRNENRLPHALILNCPVGWGETRLASVIATQMLEVQTSAVAAELAHPDLHWLRIEEDSLLYKVAQIREAVGFMQRTAAAGGYKLIIVPDAQRMNEESANTLLKSLEEPPSGGMWLLLCPDLGQLLATIRSRCQLISIRPGADTATADFVKELLREADADERWVADPPTLAMLQFELGGAPERIAQALTLEEEPLWPALSAVRSKPELIGATSDTWRPRPLADLLSSWARYAHAVVAQAQPVFMDVPDLNHAARLKWLDFADELTQSRALAAGHAGVNGRLILDRLLGKWVALFEQKSTPE